MKSSDDRIFPGPAEKLDHRRVYVCLDRIGDYTTDISVSSLSDR